MGDDFGILNSDADGGQLGVKLSQRVGGLFSGVGGFLGGVRGFFGGGSGFLGGVGGFFSGVRGFFAGISGFLGWGGSFLGGGSGFLRGLLTTQKHIGQTNPTALADAAPIAFLGGDNFIN